MTRNLFRLLAALTFVVILVLGYLAVPDAFHDPLFVGNAILFALSVSAMLTWRLGGDFARSAIGLRVLVRALLIPIALVGVVTSYFAQTTLTIAVDVVWFFVAIAGLIVNFTVRKTIDDVQQQYQASPWYVQTMSSLQTAQHTVEQPEVKAALAAMYEELRFTGRYSLESTQSFEVTIAEVVVKLQAPDLPLQHIEQLKQQGINAIKARGIALKTALNQK